MMLLQPSRTCGCEEIDTGDAEPAIGDVTRDYFVAIRGEHGGHGSVTATRLPDGTTESECVAATPR